MQFQFSRVHKFGKYQINQENNSQSFFLFVWSYGWTIYHSPGMNRNIWGTRLILKPCLEHRVLCVWSRWKFDHSLSVIQAGTPVHKTHNSAITVHRVHLVTAYVGLKECAVTKEFCKHSLPVVNACNLLNHFHI
jgi:hypothetical protein